MNDLSQAMSAPPSAMATRPRGPWATAALKLWRDRGAMVAMAVLALIVLVCLLAPVYAARVAHTDPFSSNLSGEIAVDGVSVPVMQPETEGLGLGFTPIGPTWRSAYLLGADGQGRDVAARLLYGGRNSLLISTAATLLCLGLAALLGVTAGFFGGTIDTVLNGLFDLLWAFPVYLLAISLSIITISSGLHLGPITIRADSLGLPIVIIGIIYLPYVARPIRGQVLGLTRSDFVLAAVGLGVPSYRILFRDILPNVLTTLVVFAPLMTALNMLTESALSFLSIGVQAPDASWGTIIQDGQSVLYTRPLVAIAPGLFIMITVMALNVLGDGVRDALDPRARIRLGRRG